MNIHSLLSGFYKALLLLFLNLANIAIADSETNPMIKMTTNFGVIEIELDATRAPITAANFIQYAKDGFYNDIIFHRVIPNFMIQGGGFETGMKEKTTRANIDNEADNGLTNVRGSLAMARTPDPHSASAQFFINLADNDFLNFKEKSQQGWGYVVFGKVTAGMEVVDKIATVTTGQAGSHGDVPTEDVVIQTVEVVE